MKKRLTERDEYGNADIVGVDSSDLQSNLEFDEFIKVTSALNRLAAYEDTDLLPKEVEHLKSEKDCMSEYAVNTLKEELAKERRLKEAAISECKEQLKECESLIEYPDELGAYDFPEGRLKACRSILRILEEGK